MTGSIALPGGRDSVAPGDRATLDVDLHEAAGFEVGTRFAVREGSRTVAAGVVTAIR